MLKQRHWKMSLKQLRSPRHPLRLLVLASAILFIHFNAHAAPQADFSLSVNPSSLTINPGASATATVTITRSGGFTGAVTLNAFEALPTVVLPGGIDITFNPASTTGNSSVATITVPSAAPPGAVNVIIYQFNLIPGQTLQPEPNRVCAAQTNGSGTTHPTSGDTATITYTTGGVAHTETRTF